MFVRRCCGLSGWWWALCNKDRHDSQHAPNPVRQSDLPLVSTLTPRLAQSLRATMAEVLRIQQNSDLARSAEPHAEPRIPRASLRFTGTQLPFPDPSFSLAFRSPFSSPALRHHLFPVLFAFGFLLPRRVLLTTHAGTHTDGSIPCSLSQPGRGTKSNP